MCVQRETCNKEFKTSEDTEPLCDEEGLLPHGKLHHVVLNTRKQAHHNQAAATLQNCL